MSIAMKYAPPCGALVVSLNIHVLYYSEPVSDKLGYLRLNHVFKIVHGLAPA